MDSHRPLSFGLAVLLVVLNERLLSLQMEEDTNITAAAGTVTQPLDQLQHFLEKPRAELPRHLQKALAFKELCIYPAFCPELYYLKEGSPS